MSFSPRPPECVFGETCELSHQNFDNIWVVFRARASAQTSKKNGKLNQRVHSKTT